MESIGRSPESGQVKSQLREREWERDLSNRFFLSWAASLFFSLFTLLLGL
jgi:hypothetical protein